MITRVKNEMGLKSWSTKNYINKTHHLKDRWKNEIRVCGLIFWLWNEVRLFFLSQITNLCGMG